MKKKPTLARATLAASRKRTEERDLQEMHDIADDVIESDFVPYACLTQPDTIVTKDGELLKTIKISGSAQTDKGRLRESIRQAIKKSIPDASYAIWLHTLRRRQKQTLRAHYPDPFSTQLDEAWKVTQPASAFFTNELYITIVKAGSSVSLRRDPKHVIESLYPGRDANRRETELEQMQHELDQVVQTMLGQLRNFGARALTVVKRENGIYYSEQLEFLEKLTNLEERPMPVPERDLSYILTSGEITFGFNAMEVRTADNHRRFAAILTLKEYKESTLSGIDSFLEIPCEVIITQCFSFTGAGEAQESYAKQARYLTISGDKELAEWIEIDRLQSGNVGPKDFGRQQTSLFLIASSVKQLEANVKMVQKSLHRLGMLAVREDLRFEECYWAQLPGNFAFVVRQHAIDTDHLAGFANLQSAPMGQAAGSPWGPAISLLTTVKENPYFFNFHREGANAHTIVLGKPFSGRTSLTHFLIAQARKLPLSVWYVDSHGRAGGFLKAMGGSYAAPGTPGLRLNPFQLADTQANRDFLALWFSTLIDPTGQALNHASLSFFQSLIAEIMQLPKSERRLSALLPTLREADPALGQALARFCEGGAFGALFDQPEDTFAPTQLCGWDISAYLKDASIGVPLTGYLLHRLTTALDGRPVLIVLDEGFSILETPLFSPRASSWYDYVTSQNAATLITTGDIAGAGSHAFTSLLAKKAATIFALPDASPDAEYALGFGFTPEDMTTLSYNTHGDHYVLQKRGAESTVLKMSFTGLNEITRQTLSGRKPIAPSAADELASLMGYGKPAA